SPAPGSPRTVAPAATSLRTVSGVAATRRSPAAASFSTSTSTVMPRPLAMSDRPDASKRGRRRFDGFSGIRPPRAHPGGGPDSVQGGAAARGDHAVQALDHALHGGIERALVGHV